MRKLLSIVGARPQFIKASALSREWERGDWGVEEQVLHTGQHHDEQMSEVFFRELGMAPPHHRLSVSTGNVAVRMGEMMAGIAAVVERDRPDALLVYGDTDSTWAGAWVAARWGIPLAHVEAGLRSFDRSMPEEVNRVFTDHLARWRFCPTDEAVNNLKREGLSQGIVRTGDLQWDTARWMADHLAKSAGQDGVLLTLHRPSNVDDPERLRRWIEAIAQLGERVHFPVHPRTGLVCERIWGTGWRLELAGMGFELSEPLGYLALIERVQSVRAVITDSGGLQKEAYGFQKPCVVTRPVTEWVELVEHGAVHLCGNPEGMAAAWEWVAQAVPPEVGLYGNGQAARQIAEAMSRSPWP
jgi:UDP-GlcNAc3NAcA epimerase